MPEQTSANQPVKKFKPQMLAAWMPVITAVLAVGYAIAFYFLLILPKIGPLMAGGEYDTAPLIERAASEQAYIDAMDKTLNAFKSVDQAQMDKVEEAMPSQADFPSIVEALNAVGTRHNLSLTSIDGSVDDKAVGKFGRGAIRMNVHFSNGSYALLRALLPDVERSLRLFDVDSFSFVGEDQYTIKMRSYFVNLEAAAKP